MNDFVIAPPPRVCVPVVGTERQFPVRRIYCVGRNYAAHVKEMGGDERELPFFFQKPTDSIVISGSSIRYPTLTKNLHHEIELVLAIGKGGDHININDAAGHVYGLAIGIDLTRRDLQHEAKAAGRPWEIAKAFDHSAPITPITPLDGKNLPESGSIGLSVNGNMRQSADLSQMLWSCRDIVATLSCHYALAAGDLVYTGTPAGVGPVVPGDRIVGSIDGLPDIEITVV